MRMRKGYSVKVQGMICRLCEDAISHRLLYTRGIYSVQADWFRNQVDVEYESDLISEEKINEILKETGYPVSPEGKSGHKAVLVSAVTIPCLWFLFSALHQIRIPGMETSAGSFSLGTLVYLFLIGLLTGVHCISMCGGIVLAVARENRKETRKALTAYQGGRIGGCAAIAMLCGILGRAFSFSDTGRSMILTMAGCFILLLALINQGVIPGIRKFSDLLPHQHISQAYSSLSEKKEHLTGSFVTGILNALLPCGASYAMWAAAASAGSVWAALCIGLSWSLGTAVLLFLFGMSGSFFKGRTALWAERLSMDMLTVLAVRMILNGLGLL